VEVPKGGGVVHDAAVTEVVRDLDGLDELLGVCLSTGNPNALDGTLGVHFNRGKLGVANRDTSRKGHEESQDDDKEEETHCCCFGLIG